MKRWHTESRWETNIVYIWLPNVRCQLHYWDREDTKHREQTLNIRTLNIRTLNNNIRTLNIRTVNIRTVNMRTLKCEAREAKSRSSLVGSWTGVLCLCCFKLNNRDTCVYSQHVSSYSSKLFSCIVYSCFSVLSVSSNRRAKFRSLLLQQSPGVASHRGSRLSAT